MNDTITLPPGAAFGVIAFLLALLPAGLFLWLWYLRRHDRSVPVRVVSLAFIAGLILVWPAFKLEGWASELWYILSPATVHYFVGAIMPAQSLADILLPAVGTFIVVASVEEGLRFLLLWLWFLKSKAIDQIFDGVVVGVAVGIGFATLENSLYFLDLIREGSFDTLVFVFFLRFLISTMAHISFGGIMGALLARGIFQVYVLPKQRLYAAAFLIPWLLHGLYDLLLGLNLTTYAVLMLLPSLLVLMSWMNRRDYFVISREKGKILVDQKAPVTQRARVMRRFFTQFESPWNIKAPWLRERRVRYNLLRDLEK